MQSLQFNDKLFKANPIRVSMSKPLDPSAYNKALIKPKTKPLKLKVKTKKTDVNINVKTDINGRPLTSYSTTKAINANQYNKNYLKPSSARSYPTVSRQLTLNDKIAEMNDKDYKEDKLARKYGKVPDQMDYENALQNLIEASSDKQKIKYKNMLGTYRRLIALSQKYTNQGAELPADKAKQLQSLKDEIEYVVLYGVPYAPSEIAVFANIPKPVRITQQVTKKAIRNVDLRQQQPVDEGLRNELQFLSADIKDVNDDIKQYNQDIRKSNKTERKLVKQYENIEKKIEELNRDRRPVPNALTTALLEIDAYLLVLQEERNRNTELLQSAIDLERKYQDEYENLTRMRKAQGEIPSEEVLQSMFARSPIKASFPIMENIMEYADEPQEYEQKDEEPPEAEPIINPQEIANAEASLENYKTTGISNPDFLTDLETNSPEIYAELTKKSARSTLVKYNRKKLELAVKDVIDKVAERPARARNRAGRPRKNLSGSGINTPYRHQNKMDRFVHHKLRFAV